MLYKQFFAGELEVLCSLPEFWRKVSIIYSGGDDFAVYGAWDALIALAREVQRLFHRFTEENLKDYPGPEGKTISMAIALAPETYYPLAAVYEEAGRNLELAKSGRQGLHLSAGARARMAPPGRRGGAEGYRHPPGARFPHVAAVSVPVAQLSTGAKLRRRPETQHTWRFQRRFNRILSGTRDREFQKLRTHLISEMAGRKSAEVKLRPAGLVALEWARLVTEV